MLFQKTSLNKVLNVWWRKQECADKKTLKGPLIVKEQQRQGRSIIPWMRSQSWCILSSQQQILSYLKIKICGSPPKSMKANGIIFIDLRVGSHKQMFFLFSPFCQRRTGHFGFYSSFLADRLCLLIVMHRQIPLHSQSQEKQYCWSQDELRTRESCKWQPPTRLRKRKGKYFYTEKNGYWDNSGVIVGGERSGVIKAGKG